MSLLRTGICKEIKGHSPEEMGLGSCTGPWPGGPASLLYNAWSPSNQHTEVRRDSPEAARRTATSLELLNLSVLAPQLQREGVQSNTYSQ